MRTPSHGRKIIEVHGGMSRAESDGPGQGTAFVIELPRGSQQRPGS